MIKLGVNIDHVATLRQARYALDPGSPMSEPDVIEAARAALRGGGDSITVHPRADGRHIQRGDVRRLRQEVAAPLNMEMGATAEMETFALEVNPDFACLVPETREEVTTEGGLDVAGARQAVGRTVTALQDAGIAVSLFIDPDLPQVEAASRTGARMVELHTGAFANARGIERESEVARLIEAADAARAAGLHVHAGHGITPDNLRELAAVPHLEELNIGHSLVSRAIFTGLEAAVREMREAMDRLWSGQD